MRKTVVFVGAYSIYHERNMTVLNNNLNLFKTCELQS